jgi:hypothetical protein
LRETKVETYHLSLVTDHFCKYSSRLKAFTVAFLLAGAVFLLGGCADPLEKGTVQEVPEKLQRGLTGNGTLGPRDRSDDPNIKEMHP